MQRARFCRRAADRSRRGLLSTFLWLLAAFGGCAAATSAAREPTSQGGLVPDPAGPRTCLVLSGGGARGAAHIGVLKVLEELRVPVDCVVGTSMGAIIGASWASGVPVAKMEESLRTANWDVVLADQPDRPRRSFRSKELERLRVIGAELGVRDANAVLPAGAVIGQQFELFLQSLMGTPLSRASFDTLGVPFRAIATDIESGRMVVIDGGSVNAAVRASMSVPGVFAPQERDGRLLVDGGLVRNLGVDVARGLGATRIIAVNLGTPLSGRDQLDSLVGVAGQMINILTEQNVMASLAQLRDDDILITPELGAYSAADFARAWTTIEIGERAARAVADRLAELAVSPERYAALQSGRAAAMASFATGEVRVETGGLRRVNPETVEAVFSQALQGRSDRAAVNDAVDALYAMDDFRQVSVRREREAGRDDIVIEPREKDWGPDYLRLGVALTTDLAGATGFTIGSEYRRTWLNRRGLEWRNLVTVGQVTSLRSELGQPVDIARRWTSVGYVDAQQRLDELFVGDDSVSRLRNRVGRVGFELRRRSTTDAELAFGVQRSWFDANTVTGLGLASSDGRSGEVFGRVIVDRLDNWDFPRRGAFLRAELSQADRALGSATDYRKALVEVQRAFGRDRHTVSMLLRHGDSLGTNLPLFDAFQLGGFQNLSGYQDRQILANRTSFGRVVYGYQVGERGALARGLYLGGSVEAADIRERLNGSGSSNALMAGSLFLAADTAIGPFYFGAGFGEGGERTLYLFLGRP
jgi:NTE family protein